MKLRTGTQIFAAALLAIALAGCSAPPAADTDGDGAPAAQGAAAAGDARQGQEPNAESDAASDEGKGEDKDAEAVAAGMTCKYISDYFPTFGEALERANQNGGGTVTLLADAPLSSDGSVPKVGFRTTITVKSAGETPFKIVRGEGDSGSMLQITDGFVTLKNVVFDGAAASACEGPIVLVSDLGRLTLGEGAVLTGNESATNASAVLVVGSDAYLTLEAGCEVTGCTAVDGAAVVSDGGNIENTGALFSGNAGGSNPNFLELSEGSFSGDDIAA